VRNVSSPSCHRFLSLGELVHAGSWYIACGPGSHTGAAAKHQLLCCTAEGTGGGAEWQ